MFTWNHFFKTTDIKLKKKTTTGYHTYQKHKKIYGCQGLSPSDHNVTELIYRKICWKLSYLPNFLSLFPHSHPFKTENATKWGLLQFHLKECLLACQRNATIPTSISFWILAAMSGFFKCLLKEREKATCKSFSKCKAATFLQTLQNNKHCSSTTNQKTTTMYSFYTNIVYSSLLLRIQACLHMP